MLAWAWQLGVGVCVAVAVGVARLGRRGRRRGCCRSCWSKCSRRGRCKGGCGSSCCGCCRCGCCGWSRRGRCARRQRGNQRLAGRYGRDLPTCRIATVLRKCSVILLHAYHQLAVVGYSCGIDGVINVLEGRRTVLEQSNLIIQVDVLVIVVGPIFDVEHAVGRSACCGGENSTAGTRRSVARPVHWSPQYGASA